MIMRIIRIMRVVMIMRIIRVVRMRIVMWTRRKKIYIHLGKG